MNKHELYKLVTNNPRKTVAGTIKHDCGELIASGLNRDVYECKHDANWVVKIQKTTNFDNVLEYKLWDAYYHAPEYKKWLAECLTITETGLVLYQRKVEHKSIEFYPDKVPCWFTDFKIQNFGWIGKNFVCCDYAGSFDRMTGIVPSRMRKAKWWVANASKGLKRPKEILVTVK